MAKPQNSREDFEGARVVLLTGKFRGCQGVCLGKDARGSSWAVSPDGSDEILSLVFEDDFDLSAPAGLN
jgi:hypothetical protein